MHHEWIDRYLDVEQVSASINERLACFDRMAQYVRDWHNFSDQLNLAAANSGQFEQIVDESVHVSNLPLHHLLQFLQVGIEGPMKPQQLDSVFQRRQGVAQLVRERG